MDRDRTTVSDQQRRPSRPPARFAPVVWIVVLLASWAVIVKWDRLPDLLSATVAALT